MLGLRVVFVQAKPPYLHFFERPLNYSSNQIRSKYLGSRDSLRRRWCWVSVNVAKKGAALARRVSNVAISRVLIHVHPSSATRGPPEMRPDEALSKLGHLDRIVYEVHLESLINMILHRTCGACLDSDR